jgi:hypothetical protein
MSLLSLSSDPVFRNLVSRLNQFATFDSSRTRISTQVGKAYNQEEAKVVKQRLKLPLVIVGGIRSLLVAMGVL